MSRVLGRARLGFEILTVYVRVRWLLLRHGTAPAVERLRRGLEAHATGDPEPTRVRQGVGVGRAVVKVLRVLPTDGRCLMRSLVVTAMLARRGVFAKVVIGVRPDPTFAAHAWVEVDGQPVLATNEPEYHRLAEL